MISSIVDKYGQPVYVGNGGNIPSSSTGGVCKGSKEKGGQCVLDLSVSQLTLLNAHDHMRRNNIFLLYTTPHESQYSIDEI